MSFTMEIYTLLIKYAKDYKGKTVTLAELREEPWWKCVWANWRAQAYYKMNDFYEGIEDVPEGLEHYSIVTDTLFTQYLRSGSIQKMDKATCKAIYGDKI